MTTRSDRRYQKRETTMLGEGETGASIAEMITVLIEDRKRQREEIALHRQALQVERERREQESAEHMKAMQSVSNGATE